MEGGCWLCCLLYQGQGSVRCKSRYRAGDHSVVTSSSSAVASTVVASLISRSLSEAVVCSASSAALLTTRRRMFSSPVASFSCYNSQHQYL